MSKANLLLKNDVGLVLDITESPLACTVYDLEGNEISGGGGGGVNVTTITAHIVNNTNSSLPFSSVIDSYSGYGCIRYDGYIIMSGESGTELISVPANSTYDIRFAIMSGSGYIDLILNNRTVSDGVNVEIDGDNEHAEINIVNTHTSGSFTFTIN